MGQLGNQTSVTNWNIFTKCNEIKPHTTTFTPYTSWNKLLDRPMSSLWIPSFCRKWLWPSVTTSLPVSCFILLFVTRPSISPFHVYYGKIIHTNELKFYAQEKIRDVISSIAWPHLEITPLSCEAERGSWQTWHLAWLVVAAGCFCCPGSQQPGKYKSKKQVRKTSWFGRAPPQTGFFPPDSQFVKLVSCLPHKLYIFLFMWHRAIMTPS